MRTTSLNVAPARSRAYLMLAKHWRASASKPPCTMVPDESRPTSPETNIRDLGPNATQTAALKPRSDGFWIRRRASAGMAFILRYALLVWALIRRYALAVKAAAKALPMVGASSMPRHVGARIK